jgi:hypothetical protein
MDFLFTFLLENWPYAIWIAIGGAVVWIYFMVKNKADKAEEKVSGLSEKMTRLPCEKHTESINTQKDNQKDLDVKIEKININQSVSN